MLWYLTAADRAPGAAQFHDRLETTVTNVNRLSELPGEQILALDLDPVREGVNALLLDVSESVRALGLKRMARASPALRSGGPEFAIQPWS